MNTYAAYHVMGQTTDWSGMGPTSAFEWWGDTVNSATQWAGEGLSNAGLGTAANVVASYGGYVQSVGRSLNLDRQLSQGLDETDRVAQRRINEGGECPARAYAEEGFKNLTPHGAAGHNLTEAAIGESRGVEDYGRVLSGYERFERGVNGVAAGGAVFSAPGIASLARPNRIPFAGRGGTALPDSYWKNRELPTQVAPGTRSITDMKPSRRSSEEVYQRTGHYDEYGRSTGQTHRTSHGEPDSHPNPHHHRRDPATGEELKNPEPPGDAKKVWDGPHPDCPNKP